MSLGRLVGLREAVVAELMRRFADDVRVERYAGNLTEKDLERLITKAPAIYVTIAGGTLPAQRSYPEASTRLELYIVAEKFVHPDGEAVEHDDLAASITQVVLEIAHGQCWGAQTTTDGKPFVSAPSSIEFSNAFSKFLDDMNHSLWVVAIEQPVRLRVHDDLDNKETTVPGYKRVPGDPPHLVPLDKLTTEIKAEVDLSYDPKLTAETDLKEEDP